MTNHHAHTYFSDGHGTAEEFLTEALRQGMTAYGFSDHAPIALNDLGSMKMAQLPEYLAKVDALKAEFGHRIEVHKSLEVDFIPGVMSVDSDYVRAAELDYTVGAVHYVDYLADGLPWSFQRPNPVFDRGIREIFGGDARKMVERYYGLVREMIATHPPDVVAHLDRVKKRNEGAKYWDEHAAWYQRQIEETLDAIQGAGIIMEVNTRGLYKHDDDQTYPTDWIVERAHERGIPLQVNSDAHEVANITGGFSRAYALLDRLGVETVKVFSKGGWRETEVLPQEVD